MKYAVTIDVPHLDQGLDFYCGALGLVEVARPMPTYAVLACGDSRIGLMEKSAGSRPAPGSEDLRRYERHWTPVHIDFHVGDFEAALARALAAGALCEHRFDLKGRPPIAFCSDPFGHGFCLLGEG